MKLPFVSLIIAVYDRDQVGHDDLLGCAIVPLAPPGYTPSIKSGNLPEEYEVPFETKLRNYVVNASDNSRPKGSVEVLMTRRSIHSTLRS